jgi:hypothetical protein
VCVGVWVCVCVCVCVCGCALQIEAAHNRALTNRTDKPRLAHQENLQAHLDEQALVCQWAIGLLRHDYQQGLRSVWSCIIIPGIMFY